MTLPEPWTFEDLVLESDPTWSVYDENLGRVVAVFYDPMEANDYLKWRNKKQAKKRNKKNADYGGRC